MQEVKRRISETPPPTPAENGLNHKASKVYQIKLIVGKVYQSLGKPK